MKITVLVVVALCYFHSRCSVNGTFGILSTFMLNCMFDLYMVLFNPHHYYMDVYHYNIKVTGNFVQHKVEWIHLL